MRGNSAVAFLGRSARFVLGFAKPGEHLPEETLLREAVCACFVLRIFAGGTLKDR